MENEKITLKNTKTEILDALNAALEREKNMSKIKSNPAMWGLCSNKRTCY